MKEIKIKNGNELTRKHPNLKDFQKSLERKKSFLIKLESDVNNLRYELMQPDILFFEDEFEDLDNGLDFTYKTVEHNLFLVTTLQNAVKDVLREAAMAMPEISAEFITEEDKQLEKKFNGIMKTIEKEIKKRN